MRSKYTRKLIFSIVSVGVAVSFTVWLISDLSRTSSSGPLDFVDVSADVGISRSPSGDYGVLWGDFNDDSWLDLIYMNHGKSPSVYENQMGTSFRDRFRESGIRRPEGLYPETNDRHGGACADFDNDGDADLIITHGAKRGETEGMKFDALLRNDGDWKFTEITQSAGVENTRGRARLPTWVDFDSDGWLDLYIGNFQSPNALYRNQGDGTFEDVSRTAGLGLVDSTHQAWSDYDNDGDPDVLLVWPVKLYRNDGKRFTDVTADAGFIDNRVHTPSSIAWGDYDNDGDSDVFIVSRTRASRLYWNEDGRFTVVHDAFQDKNGNDSRTGAASGDIDNDGDLDLIIASLESLYILENRDGRSYVLRNLNADISIRPDTEGDIALADYDNDGYLDLAVNTKNGKYLLRNTRKGNSWLKLRFRGIRSNRMGFGAKVWITSDDERILYREYWGDTGFFKSASCGTLHIGLGGAAHARVRVLWPSGEKQELENLSVNQTILVSEHRARNE